MRQPGDAVMMRLEAFNTPRERIRCDDSFATVDDRLSESPLKGRSHRRWAVAIEILAARHISRVSAASLHKSHDGHSCSEALALERPTSSRLRFRAPRQARPACFFRAAMRLATKCESILIRP